MAGRLWPWESAGVVGGSMAIYANRLQVARPAVSVRRLTGQLAFLVAGGERGCTTVVAVDGREPGLGYQPMSVARLAEFMVGEQDSGRWRLVAEFLEEYHWEPSEVRFGLLAAQPAGTGDDRWDVFLAALAEHLAAQDGRGAPSWAESRASRQLWFPFNTRAARVDALVHAPASFRRRGVYLAAQELGVA